MTLATQLRSSSLNVTTLPISNPLLSLELIEDLNYEKRRLAKEQRMREMETKKAI
jgi:hypothetical protein